METSVQDFLKRHGIDWRPVLMYTPMANGRIERMVGTIKKAIKNSVVQYGGDWAEDMAKDLYGYHRSHRGDTNLPFRLMYGI